MSLMLLALPVLALIEASAGESCPFVCVHAKENASKIARCRR